LDAAGLRPQAARTGTQDVPALWRGLTGTPVKGTRQSVTAAAGGRAEQLRQQLMRLSGSDRDRMLLDLVRAHVAAVLGHASPEAIEPDRTFTDLGFESLTAVELPHRLNNATGLRLPDTAIFDYPTPAALTGRLLDELLGASET